MDQHMARKKLFGEARFYVLTHQLRFVTMDYSACIVQMVCLFMLCTQRGGTTARVA
jgi:hypothetical protein